MQRVVQWFKRALLIRAMVEMLTIRLLSQRVGVMALAIYALYQLAKTEASSETVMEVLKAKLQDESDANE
jgi:hypothetical protein